MKKFGEPWTDEDLKKYVGVPLYVSTPESCDFRIAEMNGMQLQLTTINPFSLGKTPDLKGTIVPMHVLPHGVYTFEEYKTICEGLNEKITNDPQDTQ